MLSFATKDADRIAEFIIPVTTEMANTMIATVNETGTFGYFAVYYPNPENGKRQGWAVVVTPEGDEIERYYYVTLTEYHPRKDGKAQIVFNK